MKTFCTLLAVSDPSNLLKDVGMIPFSLQERYRTCLASFIEDDKDYSYQVPGLHLIPLGQSDGKNHCLEMWNSDCVSFLKKSGRDIDILNLYFLKNSILYGTFYKLLNPKGLLYLKMDGNVLKMEKESTAKLHFIRKTVYRWYLKHIVDKVSIESRRGYEFMQKEYGLENDKLTYLPNGYDDRLVGDILPWDSKENVFLTVGRLGAPEKRTEMLLEAASKVQWRNGWELHLVGPVEAGFEKREMTGVKWMGAEYDHRRLYEHYNKAKVFCLTSSYESFGIVCVEAQAFGEYLLLTPFSTTSDFTEGGKFGKVINNSDELAAAMQEIIDDDSKLKAIAPQAEKHAEQYMWSHLADKLYSFLENRA